ncbi:APC family permease [Lignipirellula cremea]|uniref:Serine/threonine exchanger SteT n=1 Tax=Lignipirellula cremea TaxID=2528010 RepID=A0A518DW74_9BACT|nr:amino acid permease [Lignipirellula cremea]QDU96091.1 Serine/threonine exchanger SteT [Lignipirellula cremea]
MSASPLEQDPSSFAGTRHTLQRVLGVRIAMAVVVGNVIGSGIFLKPGNIAGECGSFPIIISVWVLGGVLCFLGALCFAELAAMLPQAGGMYVYLREAYGRPVAFLFGWSEFLFSRPASIGALAVAFVGSLALANNWQLSSPGQAALAGLLIGSVAWINILGVIWGGRLQMVVTVIKVAFLALVALSPLLVLPFSETTFELANYATTVVPRQTTLAGQVGAVLLAVMWAYNGWDGVTPLAEEIRDPGRNIPLALFGGIGVLVVLYVSANFAYHGVLSMSQIADAGDHAAEQMLYRLFGSLGLSAMSAVIMCSTFGAINTNFLQAPRITFAMGRDGVFFRILGAVHAVYRTPSVAIVVNALMAFLLVLAVALAKFLLRDLSAESFRSNLAQQVIASLQADTIFDLLTNFVIFTASIFYTLTVLAVIVLRIRRPDLKRPYKAWGYPLAPAAFLAVYVWFLWQIYWSKPLESHTGLMLIALGIPVYFLYQYLAGKRTKADS